MRCWLTVPLTDSGAEKPELSYCGRAGQLYCISQWSGFFRWSWGGSYRGNSARAVGRCWSHARQIRLHYEIKVWSAWPPAVEAVPQGPFGYVTRTTILQQPSTRSASLFYHSLECHANLPEVRYAQFLKHGSCISLQLERLMSSCMAHHKRHNIVGFS